MHAHVRDILGALFPSEVGSNGETVESLFEACFSKYRAFLAGESARNMADSIRFAIFNYCRFSENARSLARAIRNRAAAACNDVDPSTSEQMLTLMGSHYRDLNEIMVHVLDFNYFFSSSKAVYLDYLWESWATVPSVYDDPEHYLIRSIATLATSIRGTIAARFDAACEMVLQRIERLSAQSPGNQLFHKAIDCLTNRRSELQVLATPAIYLACMTNAALCSSMVSGELLDDDLRQPEIDGTHHYQLDIGSFSGSRIASPVSFLVHMLNQASANSSLSRDEIEFRSAWIFLVVSSALN
jgi:hypothetical protein